MNEFCDKMEYYIIRQADRPSQRKFCFTTFQIFCFEVDTISDFVCRELSLKSDQVFGT